MGVENLLNAAEPLGSRRSRADAPIYTYTPRRDMPLTISVDKKRRLVITEGSGVLTLDDIASARAEARSNPDFDPTFDELFDVRGIVEARLSGAEMARIAASSVLGAGVFRAFVVANQKQHGLARMFSGLAEPHDQRVDIFRDMAVAEAWLASRRKAAGSA
jgi:hypothetical protein